MCETLEYLMKDINVMYSDEEKLDTINKTIHSIRSNQFVMKLIDKIKNNNLVKDADLLI